MRARTSVYWLQHTTGQSGTLCDRFCETDKTRSTTQSESSQHAPAWPVSGINCDLQTIAQIISRTVYATLPSVISARGLP